MRYFITARRKVPEMVLFCLPWHQVEGGFLPSFLLFLVPHWDLSALLTMLAQSLVSSGVEEDSVVGVITCVNLAVRAGCTCTASLSPKWEDSMCVCVCVYTP